MKTKLSIRGDRFFINDMPTYCEIPNCKPEYQGLLMNSRMIQGVFDDRQDASRFNRYGKQFDPDRNTEELVAALPEWYSHGLRAITVGFQGGGACFTIDNYTVQNSPYSNDGALLETAYRTRMKKIIDAADTLGMIVIVSLFYGAQTRFLEDDRAVMQAVKTAANWLRDEGFTNVIIEIANEHDITCYQLHPVLYTESGVVQLIEIAKRESGGLPVGCSGTGGYFDVSIAEASDVILIHGNDQSRQRFYNLIQKAKAIKPARPIVCNEDSQALSQMGVALHEGVSWGYYNNMTKQEPPVYWGITEGEDHFFALRLALALGIQTEQPPLEQQFYLQGLEPHMTYDGKRWIRLASLYPEAIDHVEFYRDGKLFATAYDDPFTIHYIGNWLQQAVTGIENGEEWCAKVVLVNGEEILTHCKLSL